jgi:hypothetical protein
MIYTIEQANDYNTLLDIKERIEEKHKPKSGFNVINRMPKIIIMSNIEEDNKVNPDDKANSIENIKPACKTNSAEGTNSIDKASLESKANSIKKANPVDKINYRSQVGVVYAPDPALARLFESAPPSFCRFSNFVFGLALSLCLTLAVRVSGCWLLPYSISVCSVGNVTTNTALLRSFV